jgi:hypothetical protein
MRLDGVARVHVARDDLAVEDDALGARARAVDGGEVRVGVHHVVPEGHQRVGVTHRPRVGGRHGEDQLARLELGPGRAGAGELRAPVVGRGHAAHVARRLHRARDTDVGGAHRDARGHAHVDQSAEGVAHHGGLRAQREEAGDHRHAGPGVGAGVVVGVRAHHARRSRPSVATAEGTRTVTCAPGRRIEPERIATRAARWMPPRRSVRPA